MSKSDASGQALDHAVGGRLVVPRNAVTSAEAVAGTSSATANGSARMRGGDTSHGVSIARFLHPSRQRRDVRPGHLRYIRFVDFRLSDEQELLRASVREFAEAEMRPHVMEWDEAQHFPMDLLPKLAQLGLMGIQFAEQFGGSAMSAVDYCICIEELARVVRRSRSRWPLTTGCARRTSRCSAPMRRRRSTCRGWCAARCSARGD